MKLTKLRSMQKRITVTALIFIAPVLIYNIIFRIAPIFISLGLSFTSYTGFKEPVFTGLSNYMKLFSDEEFWNSIYVTFKFSLEVLPLNMIISLFLAIMVNYSFKFIGIFRAIYYLPVITPMVAASMIWLWLYDPNFGLFNYLLTFFGFSPLNFLKDPSTALESVAVMRIWRGVGWNMLIYLAGLQGIPKQLYEAASIDGAKNFRKFFSITLPLLRNVHIYVLIVGLIQTLQTFTEIYVMTGGGPLGSTTTVGFLVYRAAFDYLEMGYASAMSFILGIIIMIISVLLFMLNRNKEGELT